MRENEIKIQFITQDFDISRLVSSHSNLDAITWASSGRGQAPINFNADVLVVDSDVSSISGPSKTKEFKSKLRSLEDESLDYVKSGGIIVYIDNGENAKGMNEIIERFGTVSLRKAEEIHSIRSTTSEDTMDRFLEFVDTTSRTLEINIEEGFEVIATSRDSSEPLAGAFSTYLDAAGYKREALGEFLILPRPNSFKSLGKELVNNLIRIGEQRSPRGTSPNQRNLHEFINRSDQPSEDISSILHDRLEERCLPKYAREEYADAAKTAGQILEEQVRQIGPTELEGKTTSKLMTDAFNPNGGPLQFSDRNDEQKGVMFLYSGAIKGIRNVLAHRTPEEGGEKYLDNLDREKTRDIIFFVNFLLNLLEDYDEEQINSC